MIEELAEKLTHLYKAAGVEQIELFYDRCAKQKFAYVARIRYREGFNENICSESFTASMLRAHEKLVILAVTNENNLS